MDAALPRDRLRHFIDLMLNSLNEDVDGADIASRGCLSRYHFDRLVASAIRESPGAFRRRLLLERAAWELRATRRTITKIAFRSGYTSVEGFTRAFSRTFGTSPARYRKAPNGYRLDAPNGIHFHPPGGISIPGPTERSAHMDFVDRIVGHDIWFTGRLLDSAAELPDEALDRPVVEMWGTHEENRASVRALLNALVANKENWSASLSGRAAPEDGGTSVGDMKRRLEVAGPEFIRLIREIKDRGDWDAGFVDALCDPPESFTHGGMLAHVATFSAYRRTQAALALRELGVTDIGIGDPIEWERSLA